MTPLRFEVDAIPALAFASMADVSCPDLTREPLPLLWHWLYASGWPDQADIGPDGHPLRHTLPAPPEPGWRRMWAGGRVHRRRPLSVGDVVECHSRIASSTRKRGRAGDLTIVVVTATLTVADQIHIEEERDIVYLADAPAPVDGSVPDAAMVAPDVGERPVSIDPTRLFRFSALTRNAHRIHYDREYATAVEGYGDLVVHGPLQAMLMAEAARATSPATPASIDYRLQAPLLLGQGLVVGAAREGTRTATWVRDGRGRRTATGIVTSADPGARPS